MTGARSNPHRMRSRSSLGLALAALLGVATTARAAGEEVVVKVGEASMTRAEIEKRLAHMPRMQLATLGSTDAQIAEKYVRDVVVPELVMGEAGRKKLAERPDLRLKIHEVYRAALMNALQKEVAESVTTAEIQAYYAANRDKFVSPERIQIWRILVPSHDDAAKIIADAKAPGGDKKWTEVARERSVDKATNERGGNLGMIAADGSSNEPTVKVDPALFAAAKGVKDGEIVPQPVAEGPGFAVVWRRGSTPAVTRSVEMESQTIKQMLQRTRMEAKVKDLLATLRKDQVHDENPTLTGQIELSQNGELVPRKRPGVTQPRAAGKPQPSAVPGGLR